ncbi:uncharacterized protein BROUX77_005351 [Berkeleyomyces rouxiae]|uniref:uncharacterized protein n=1 Tax=Berkeleyomyces rouxiae TaxID=2035830 RepID=UPI003B7B2AF5
MVRSFSSVLATVLAVSQITSALPARSSETSDNTQSTSPSTWSLHQVRDVSTAISGISALAEIYSKYGVLMPEDLKDALDRNQKRATVLIPAFPLGTCGNKLLVPAKIGIYGRNTFNLIFDTSSGDFWVHSKDTANPQALQSAYTRKDHFSSTELEGYTWATEDPNGNTASGIVYLDTAAVGSLRDVARAIQVARTAPKSFWDLEAVSGVMGMAFRSRNSIQPYPQANVFDNAVSLLDEGLFTVDMKHCSHGEVDFGFIDDHGYDGSIGYTDVFDNKGYWNFTSNILGTVDIKNNGKVKVKAKEDSAEYVIADTASELLMLPMKYNVDYYKKIAGGRYSKTYGGFVFPCANQLPNFSFMSGSNLITIPGRYLKHSCVNQESNLCFGGLQPSNNLGLNVLGSPAFKSAFVVFNPVKNQIGWARKGLWDEQLSL